MNLQKSKFTYELSQELAFIELEVAVKVNSIDRNEIYISPNERCSSEDKKKILSAATEKEQIEIYQELPFSVTYLHEGIRFGANYALSEMMETSTFNFYFNLKKYNTAMMNEIAAYAAVVIIWKHFKYNSDKPPFYDEERQRFFFPNIDKFPIGQSTKNDFHKIFRDKNLSKKELKKAEGLYNSMKNKYEEDYFQR